MGMVWQVSSDKWKAPLVKVPHVWLNTSKILLLHDLF